MKQKLDLGRTAPCALGDAGLYLVRVEGLASGVDAVLSWERGGYIRSGCGREVSRLVVHSDADTKTLFSEPNVMMDVIVNAPFSIIRIQRISLILLDLATSSVEVVDFEGFVAWPPVHVPKVA